MDSWKLKISFRNQSQWLADSECSANICSQSELRGRGEEKGGPWSSPTRVWFTSASSMQVSPEQGVGNLGTHGPLKLVFGCLHYSCSYADPVIPHFHSIVYSQQKCICILAKSHELLRMFIEVNIIHHSLKLEPTQMPISGRRD